MQNLRHRAAVIEFFNVMLDESFTPETTDAELVELDADLASSGSEVTVADIDQAFQDGLDNGVPIKEQLNIMNSVVNTKEQAVT